MKRFYRLLKTPRFKHGQWLKLLYADARRVVEVSDKERVVIALDPVNFEKAYAKKIEGISTVRKSTPPGTLPRQDARLTKEYPALMAYIVNLPQPAIPYARLFSYTMPEFLSENREIERAMRTTFVSSSQSERSVWSPIRFWIPRRCSPWPRSTTWNSSLTPPLNAGSKCTMSA